MQTFHRQQCFVLYFQAEISAAENLWTNTILHGWLKKELRLHIDLHSALRWLAGAPNMQVSHEVWNLLSQGVEKIYFYTTKLLSGWGLDLTSDFMFYGSPNE